MLDPPAPSLTHAVCSVKVRDELESVAISYREVMKPLQGFLTNPCWGVCVRVRARAIVCLYVDWALKRCKCGDVWEDSTTFLT